MAIQIISRSMFQIQFNFDVRSVILSHYCGIPNVPAKSEDGSDAQFRGTSCMGSVVQDVKYMACHNAVLTKVWGTLRFKNVQNEVMKFIVILMIRTFSKKAPHFRKTRIPKPLLMLISLCRYWF